MLPVRQTLIFGSLIVVLGWLLVEGPLVEKVLRTGGALALFLLASLAIEHLRQRYLGDYLDDE